MSFDARVKDLVDRIPIEDIPGLLGDNSTGSSDNGISPYGWWSEGLHGVAISPGVIFEEPTQYATSFPQVINLASSFNRSLFYQIGAAISTEARLDFLYYF